MQRIFSFVCILLAATASSHFGFRSSRGEFLSENSVRINEEKTEVKLNALQSYIFSNNSDFALFSCNVLKIDGNAEARIEFKPTESSTIFFYDSVQVYSLQSDILTEGKTVTFAVPLGISVNVRNASQSDVTLRCNIRFVPFPN